MESRYNSTLVWCIHTCCLCLQIEGKMVFKRSTFATCVQTIEMSLYGDGLITLCLILMLFSVYALVLGY